VKKFKTVAATLLATSMLAGQSAAAQKPQIKIQTQMVAPKASIIQSIRPNIVRPGVQVRVNRDRLRKKAPQADGQADALPGAAAAPVKAPAATALIPPKRLPQPRPDFEERAGDIADLAGIDGIGEINPDDLRVATNPHGAVGRLGDFGLPGEPEEDQQGARPGPSGPFGRLGGNDSIWNDPRGAMGSAIPNPAGENSHGKDAPETAPGVRVTPGSIAAAIGGVASGSDNGDHVFEDEDGSATGRPGGRFQFNGSGGADGEYQSEIYTNEDRETGDKTTVIIDADGRTIENIHPNGDRSASRTEGGDIVEYDYGTAPRHVETAPVVFDNAGPKDTGVNKLENPDYVGGGGYIPVNCGSVECNASRKGKAGLRLSDGMVRALTDPEHSAAGPRNGAAPIVTRNDLLSQYDPEFNGGGGPTPIDKPRIQSD
jgi:hypothetical protein